MERGFTPLPIVDKRCFQPAWQLVNVDEEQLAKWQKRWPTADVAVRCDGMCVVDVDPRHGGLVTLADWIGKHGSMDAGRIAGTKNKGLHYYYTMPEEEITKKRFDGIDIKAGKGAYVVAPPSKGYEWIEDGPLGPPPSWLRVQLCQSIPSVTQNSCGTISPKVAAAWMKDHKHGRNNQLYRLTLMVDGDLSLLRLAAQETGLSDREIDRTIRSALKAKGGG